MIKHFCDRCGKEVEDDELIVNKLGCKPSLMLYTDLYDERISLCPDCQKDLMQWVRDAKEKKRHHSHPQLSLFQPMREKNQNTDTHRQQHAFCVTGYDFRHKIHKP